MSSRLAPRELLRELFDAAVERASPSVVLPRFLPPPPKGRTVVVGYGKAGGAMAQAVEALWPANAPLSGLVVTRYGHVPRRPASTAARIEVVEAAHPVPDAAGAEATRRIMRTVQGLTADDLVLVLVSGGGSSLLSLPAEGVTLDEKRAVHQALLKSGAAIDEMNTVRKHLSAVKGGRLAALARPARVVTLVISDVPGDDPSVVASGPTLPDASTCADALAILDRHRIAVSATTRARLASGDLETPKPGDPAFAGHAVHTVATPLDSLRAAAARAEQLGLAAHVLSDTIEGESREVGIVHAGIARAIAGHGVPFAAPCVLLSGGETTVTVAGPGGRGGRAGEFALALAVALDGHPRIHALAADTDGIDGSEDNAGAQIGPTTLARARALGLSPRAMLDAHDSYGFFTALGDLVVTGPTHTNVNDFRAILIGV